MNLKIAFLFDKNNNWFKTYQDKLAKELYKIKFNYKFFYNYKLIKNYDCVFLINYTKILSTNFLKKNKINLVLHCSKLPYGKGFAPLQWQILKKKKYIHMSLIKAIEKVDAGDVYLVKKLKLNGNELYDEIRKKEASLMIKMILQFLKAYPSKNCSKQKGKSIFFRKRTPMDSKLDINKSLKKLFPLLRIANNEDWPAFFYYKNKKYKIKIYKYDN